MMTGEARKPVKRFDELDKKVFNEMPLLVPLLQSTFNKVGHLFDQYSQRIISVIEQQKLNYWELDKRKIKTRYAPLYDSAVSFGNQKDTMKQIQELQNIFEVYNMICLKERKRKNRTNLREIFIFGGYYFEIDEGKTSNQLYFQVSQFDIKNIEEALYKKEQYQKMAEKISYKTEISHPIDGVKENDEYINVYLRELDEDKIEQLFLEFEKHILGPFLQDLDKK